MVKCEICGREFSDIRRLSAHIRSHKIMVENYYLKYINSVKGSCKICGNDTKFISMEKGYYDHCSYKCAQNDPVVHKKQEDSNFIKTGYKHPSQNPIIKSQKENTYYEKTGYINPSQNPIVKIQKENTCYEKTGYKHPAQNPDEIKKREKNYYEKTGYKNPSQKPEIAEKHKITFSKLLKKFPELVKIENLIEGPNGEISGRCKNSNCTKNKETDGYFILNAYQINARKNGINSIADGNYFYCCEECKHECIAYGKSAKQLGNLFNPQDELSKISPSDLSAWRNEVFTRQLLENKEHNLNYCEICHKTENLVGHHILPQKLYPESALDPDNGVILCSECHNKYGHTKGTECSTGNLANIICK
jgi:hypothetical protein